MMLCKNSFVVVSKRTKTIKCSCLDTLKLVVHINREQAGSVTRLSVCLLLCWENILHFLLMLYEFLKIALDNGLARIRCNVLNWNKSAISFYEKIGGIVEEDWRQCTFTHEAMKVLVK